MARPFDPERLQRARKIAGLSAADVAEAIDRSESLVWMVESGHKIPASETLAAWCAVLGISIDSVFPEKTPV